MLATINCPGVPVHATTLHHSSQPCSPKSQVIILFRNQYGFVVKEKTLSLVSGKGKFSYMYNKEKGTALPKET